MWKTSVATWRFEFLFRVGSLEKATCVVQSISLYSLKMPLNGIIPLAALQSETIWADAARYQDAERQYYEVLSRGRLGNQAAINNSNNSSVGNQQAQEQATSTSSLASEIAHARQKIQNFLKSGEYESDNLSLVKRVQSLELENKQMQQKISELCTKVALLETKVDDCVKVRQKQNSESKSTQRQSENTNTKPSVNGPTDDDDDIDLFGSDEETEEELKVKQERVKAYENKKSKKPALVAKSSVVLDVKPWSDETDMKELEIAVRKIQMDGLTWGASKLVPLAYGILKLQIIATVVDDKVSVDGLQESIEEIEDLVQSVDIAAFNKL